jgi:hypothetical protein
MEAAWARFRKPEFLNRAQGGHFLAVRRWRNLMDSLRMMPALSTIVWVAAGIGIGYVLWKSGIGLLRSFNTPMPAPPPAGELRKVNVRYRCSVCGLEIRLTLAPDQDPPPPRHCLEDMDIVAPLYE